MPVILLIAWCSALFLPVATTDHLNEDQTFLGWQVMLLGILGPLIGQLSAYANPLFLGVLTYVSIKRERASPTVLKVGAVVFALAVINALFWGSVPDDSGDNPIRQYYAGYFVWLAVMGATAVWCALLSRSGRISSD